MKPSDLVVLGLAAEYEKTTGNGWLTHELSTGRADSYRTLLADQLVYETNSGYLRLTERGQALWLHIANLPLPVEKRAWEMPPQISQ